jgi:hypothetical protein
MTMVRESIKMHTFNALDLGTNVNCNSRARRNVDVDPAVVNGNCRTLATTEALSTRDGIAVRARREVGLETGRPVAARVIDRHKASGATAECDLVIVAVLPVVQVGVANDRAELDHLRNWSPAML